MIRFSTGGKVTSVEYQFLQFVNILSNRFLPRVALKTICDECRYLLNRLVSRVLKSSVITILQSGYLHNKALPELRIKSAKFL